MSFNELFGSIPDGWRSCTLGELVKEFNGSIQTGPFGSQLHAADYVEDGIPSIMPKNIRIDGVDDSDIARVSPEDIERLSKYKVQTGDIVYSRRGDVEKCSLITEKENGWLCGTGCLRVRLQTEEVSPEFLHAYLCHPAVREWIVRHAVGATMPNLNTSILSALPVLVPTSDSMAVITSNWNALSSKLVINSKINQTLEQMALAIFKSWFVDFDPVKAKMKGEQPEGMDATTASLFPEKLVESELGLIPDRWEVSEIGDEVTVVGGGTPSKKNDDFWVDGHIHWTSPKDLSGVQDKVLLDTASKVTEAGLKKISSGLLPVDTVLLSSRAPVGYLALAKVPMAINQGYIAMKCEKQLPPEFVLQWCVHRMDEIKQRASGSTFAEISKKSFKPISVVVPTDEVLSAYQKLVKPLYDAITSNARQNEQLSSLRDTLLPKLLSGEVNLTFDEVSE